MTNTHDHQTVDAAVHELFDGKGDQTIIDYICGILEDEDFEFGNDGGDAVFEAVGAFLVSTGLKRPRLLRPRMSRPADPFRQQ